MTAQPWHMLSGTQPKEPVKIMRHHRLQPVVSEDSLNFVNGEPLDA